MKIDITKRDHLNEILSRLSDDTEAQWGLMKPQHMLEHMAKTLQFSNGKKQAGQRVTDEEAKQAKENFIYTEIEMSKGLKSSLAGEVPGPFEFSSLEDAKKNLNRELDDFENYFARHPQATFIQPRFGKLSNKEWIIYHNKHFTHHFKQFGLL